MCFIHTRTMHKIIEHLQRIPLDFQYPSPSPTLLYAFVCLYFCCHIRDEIKSYVVSLLCGVCPAGGCAGCIRQSLNEVSQRRRRHGRDVRRRPRRHRHRPGAGTCWSRRRDAAGVRRLRRPDPRPVPAQRARPRLARRLRPVRRLSLSARRQVLRPRRSTLLSSRLLQVSRPVLASTVARGMFSPSRKLLSQASASPLGLRLRVMGSGFGVRVKL